MDSSRAVVLAVATIFGLFVLAQGEGAHASKISWRTPHAPATSKPRCVSGAAAPTDNARPAQHPQDIK